MQEQNEIKLNRAPVWRAFRAAAPQTLPVFAGYLVLGLGYGIYVQSLGAGPSIVEELIFYKIIIRIRA